MFQTASRRCITKQLTRTATAHRAWVVVSAAPWRGCCRLLPRVSRLKSMLPQPKLRPGKYRNMNEFDVAEYVIGLCDSKNRQLRIPDLVAHISRKFNFSPEDIIDAIQQQMFSRPNTFKFERTSEIFICPRARKGSVTYKKQTRLFLKQKGCWLSHVWVFACRHANKTLLRTQARSPQLSLF